MEALVRASTFATGIAALDVVNAETIVVAGKTYTFQTTLTNVDGNVHIGTDVDQTLDNLVDAINVGTSRAASETGEGSGTGFAAAMTGNGAVYAARTATGEITVYALIPGTIGNLIAVDAGTSAVSWNNATLESGTGNVGTFFDDLFEQHQLNSAVIQHLRAFTAAVD